MQNRQAEKILARILGIGAAFTTVFVVSSNVTDPVNVTKLLSLGIFAISASFVFFVSDLRFVISRNVALATVILLFVSWSLISALVSSSPFSQNYFGVYGRNNGFLTYFLLSLILLTSLALRLQNNFSFVIKALLIAGYINVAYCMWVSLFGDFIGWSNTYGNILGTLGNPNFIGSFLGIFLGSYCAVTFSQTSSKFLRYSSLVVIPSTIFLIIESHAIQGRVVGALGLGIVGFFYIRSKLRPFILWIYTFIVGIIGSLALLGALQVGPLTKYIYKTSVSLRGQYWLSGWNAGKDHPVFGIGMDSLGDWYRRARDAHALELPGPETVVNASHNVVLDIFAFGGVPLLLAYLTIIAFSIMAALKIALRNKQYDPHFVGLFSAWAGYQVQSVISINQIGLAVWGWLLSGALISYERATRENNEERILVSRKAGKNLMDQQVFHLQMFAAFGALVGLLLTIPPLLADSKWRSAQVSQSLPLTEETMKSSYFNPLNSTKYLVNIQTLENSNLFELSHRYAIESVDWNPDVFELWKTLYFLRNSTNSEKEMALSNMKRLDPLNPDVTAR